MVRILALQAAAKQLLLPWSMGAWAYLEERNVKMRGKVLREPNSGPGLLMVQGQQYRFSLDGVWKSETPPKPGLDIEADLDQNLQIIAITAVPEAQLAKEQAEKAMGTIKEGVGKVLRDLIARFGLPTLVASGFLIVGWFFMTSLSIQDARANFTFWQVLGVLNASNPYEAILDPRGAPNAGFYGFLAIVALAGPLAHYFWKDRRAVLGGLLPLLLMLLVALMVRSTINNVGGAETANLPAEALRQMREEAWRTVSLGLGAYSSGLVSLYFAAIGVKQFRLLRGVANDAAAKSTQAAA